MRGSLREHRSTDGTGPGERALLPLPEAPYDACEKQAGRVSSLSLVRYRTNDYSAPVAYGHRNVLVRGYVDRVVISAGPRSSPAITAPTSGMILCSTPSTTCRCWSRRRRPWTRPLPCKDGTFPRSLPHCAGCWSPARDEGASGSSSRYCGYSSIFRLGRSTPQFGAIMDWHSRHVLAWKLSNTMDTSFCVAALEEALGKGRPEIFNTDQGSQFTSEAFTQTLQEQRVQVSMDGKGRYLDNIFVERLWRSIKYEEVYLKAYQTVAEARTGINAYLEFYNRQRPHQALGYRTPAEVYQHGQEERGAAAEEAGLPSGLVKPSAGVGDSLNLALVLS